MSEMFDITFLSNKERAISVTEFEKRCSSFFGLNLLNEFKQPYFNEDFMLEMGSILISQYKEPECQYHESTISFESFVLKENLLPDFFDFVDVLFELLNADIAVCSYEINAINLDGLFQLEDVIKNINRFPIVFLYKKSELNSKHELKHSSAFLFPDAQDLTTLSRGSSSKH